jgi:hypothetical protein
MKSIAQILQSRGLENKKPIQGLSLPKAALIKKEKKDDHGVKDVWLIRKVDIAAVFRIKQLCKLYGVKVGELLSLEFNRNPGYIVYNPDMAFFEQVERDAKKLKKSPLDVLKGMKDTIEELKRELAKVRKEKDDTIKKIAEFLKG